MAGDTVLACYFVESADDDGLCPPRPLPVLASPAQLSRSRALQRQPFGCGLVPFRTAADTQARDAGQRPIGCTCGKDHPVRIQGHAACGSLQQPEWLARFDANFQARRPGHAMDEGAPDSGQIGQAPGQSRGIEGPQGHGGAWQQATHPLLLGGIGRTRDADLSLPNPAWCSPEPQQERDAGCPDEASQAPGPA
ncbi:MAG: hypothetical protein VKP57_11350 [Candidatus Sericytochromatia bacterium]|nr:hypothetical protein [Candidatus Sericytochromatia bacterium]